MPATTAATIGSNVRAEMARTKVSQAALGEHLNLSQSSVSMRLRGGTPFSAHELGIVARVLGVPIDDLYRPASGQDAA